MQRRLRSMGFTLLIALYFTVFQNMALWHHLSVLYAAQKVQGWGFLLTVPVFIFVLMNVVFTLLIWPRVYKVIIPVLILAATGVTYAMYQYGVVFDHGMMVNVVETDTHEATSYLSPALFGWFIGLAVIPLILLWRVKVDFGASTRQLLLKKGMSILLSLVVVGAIAGLYYKDYASLLRNHSEIKAMINPTNFLSAGYRVLKERVYEAHLPFEVIGTDAVDRNAALAEKGKPNVLVLVVGETARAQDYALDGYDRNTNPYLSKESILSYQNVSSCGTATAVSVPCMFSRMTHDNYDALTARHQEGLLDVLKHAGVSVTWIDNNSGSKGVANRVNVIITQGSNDPTLCPDGMCYDGILLKPLKQQLAHIEGDTVIVLHLMGSHGPTYAKRYPKAFARFKPVCETSDLQQCSQEALINTYDNSLVYTDYILDQIIGLLKEESSKVNGAMLYMSDHGESLGEQGIYLHGMPYSIAPSQQTHIPMITWFSPTFTQHQRLDGQCMSQVAQHDKLSHDNVFHTVLGMMDISTNTYDPHLDMLAACRQ
ncbi:phosphoethanolamine transferase EptA [Photobacterium aphoticum]|uniref:Phosphoethanolamine transferase EptA n=1 Tax=Photobacterium aphoticum TaxID=754436 RepID=A0A090QV72_9GAMM|nr:phosphoethanolamine transferase EptA [Photobacterium aphoticum]